MADVYELNTIADLLKIPPEKLGECLRDIEYAIDLCHLAGGEHAVGMSFDSFKWTDDGKHDVDMAMNGEPLLKLSVTEESALSHAAGQDGEQCRAGSGDREAMATRLRELICEYWDLAYDEGVDKRNSDTPAGDANRVANEIETIIRALSRGVPEGK